MSSLYNFPCDPNKTSKYAKNERMVSNLPSNELSASFVDHYPQININRELFHANRSRDDKNVLVHVEESIVKAVIRTYFEKGLFSSLEVASKEENVFGSGARYIIKMLDVGRQMKVFFRPHLKIRGEESIIKFTQTRNWLTSPIRCVSWHPNFFKLAVAAEDDSVRLYSESLYSDQHKSPPILKVNLTFEKVFCFTNTYVNVIAWLTKGYLLHVLAPVEYVRTGDWYAEWNTPLDNRECPPEFLDQITISTTETRITRSRHFSAMESKRNFISVCQHFGCGRFDMGCRQK